MRARLMGLINAAASLAKARKGQSVMGLLVLIVVIIGVGIPLTNNVIDSGNLTGITATIVNFIPAFLALLVLVSVARGMQ